MTGFRTGCWLAVGLVAGCYTDLTGSNGELGRLDYSLATDYEAGSDQLTDVPLLTRYPVSISVSTTAKGRKDADGDEGRVHHRSFDAGVSAFGGHGGPAVGGFDVKADQAGPVTIESMLDRHLFDRITLTFADPDDLELVTWVRAPWQDEWQESGGLDPLAVEAGSQIAFLAIPRIGDTRIGGNFTPEVAVDPQELAVPDDQVVAVQEGGITSGADPVTFYALGEGDVTFTLADPEHGIDITKTVTVTPPSP